MVAPSGDRPAWDANAVREDGRRMRLIRRGDVVVDWWAAEAEFSEIAHWMVSAAAARFALAAVESPCIRAGGMVRMVEEGFVVYRPHRNDEGAATVREPRVAFLLARRAAIAWASANVVGNQWRALTAEAKRSVDLAVHVAAVPHLEHEHA